MIFDCSQPASSPADHPSQEAKLAFVFIRPAEPSDISVAAAVAGSVAGTGGAFQAEDSAIDFLFFTGAPPTRGSRCHESDQQITGRRIRADHLSGVNEDEGSGRNLINLFPPLSPRRANQVTWRFEGLPPSSSACGKYESREC